MTLQRFLRMTRPVALVAVMAAVLLLGLGRVAWAAPAGQGTVPPAPTNTPVPPAAPPQSTTASRSTVGPGESDTITSQDGTATVLIDANDLGVSGTLEVAPVAAGTLPPAGAGFTFLGKQVNVTLFDAAGNAYVNPSFTNPILVCFNYTDADLALVGGDPNNFVVQTYNENTGVWESLPTTVDTANRRACGSVTHLTLFTMAAQSAKIVKVLDLTGGESTLPALWPAVTIALLVVAGLAIGRRVRSGARK